VGRPFEVGEYTLGLIPVASSRIAKELAQSPHSKSNIQSCAYGSIHEGPNQACIWDISHVRFLLIRCWAIVLCKTDTR